MSIDNEIRKAFERHESDVQAQTGAWHEVERRIGRSQRRRLVATALGAAIAIAGAVVVVPRIGGRQAVPPVVSGWNEFQPVKSGLRFLYPSGWTASEVGPLGYVQIVPPGPPR